MQIPKPKIENVAQYMSYFGEPTRGLLESLRKTIKQAAPEAEELISYNMPAFKLSGMLVYYAGYAKHIGFYPTPSGIEVFKKQLVDYKCSKGAIQFPLDQPLPLELISKIVKFRVEENLEKAKLKKNKG